MITDEQLAKEREAIPFTPTKRLMRDDILYVVEKDVPHPVYGYSKYHKEYSVIDLRGYRKGYEPRLDIKGLYTPNPTDTFRLQDGHLPPYQPTTTGDKLLAEMRRLGVHKAFRIGMPPTKATASNPNGTCYEDAWRYLIKEEEGELIHGTVESLGRRIGHAWVKLPTGFIWEPETRLSLKKADFEAIVKPQEEARYSATEAAIMLARVGKHGPWTKEEREQFLKGGNPTTSPREGNPGRVRFDRASIDSAIAAARRLKSEKDLYIFATYLGYTIESRPPIGMQKYVVVHPDGSAETVDPLGPAPNPIKKLVSEGEAIGMLERLSMTPDEARRSLFGSEEGRRNIMIAVQERVKREQNKWAPFDPREGPPLPRILGGLSWPWRKP